MSRKTWRGHRDRAPVARHNNEPFHQTVVMGPPMSRFDVLQPSAWRTNSVCRRPAGVMRRPFPVILACKQAHGRGKAGSGSHLHSRTPRHGAARTDQPNQDNPEEESGSHTPPLCRRIGRHGRRYPLRRSRWQERLRNRRSGPRSHVARPREIDEVVSAEPGGGDQNAGRKAARAQRCGQCAHPLWPDNLTMSGLCLVRRKQLSEEDRRREFAFVMSSPQLWAMNE
jgi:hypothetical protein